MIDKIFKNIDPNINLNTVHDIIREYRMDSFDIINLIEAINNAYNININVSKVDTNNLRTKDSLINLIQNNGGNI